MIQLEDCQDVMNCHYPQFQVMYLFDHSCGHDRGKEDGLLVGNMNVSWGGRHNLLQGSTIICANGFLGPYSSTLQVTDVQHFSFRDEDNGPHWMLAEEQAGTKHDKPTRKH